MFNHHANVKRVSLAAAALLSLAGVVQAGEDASVSRHTFRGVRSGTADQLAQTRLDAAELRVVQAQPLRGETSPRAVSSTNSGATSDLLGAARVAGAPLRSATAAVQPMTAIVSDVRQATPLVVASAEESAQPVLNDRAAVDNNARLAGNYAGYQTTTVSHEQAQLALAAHRVQEYGYANTYGTYSPTAYHGRFEYSYAPRTYYRPTYYASVAYSTPVYYTSSYYTPTYRYSYCPPVYYRPSYRYYGSYCNSYRPSYYFSYGRGRYCGSSWGFSIRW